MTLGVIGKKLGMTQIYDEAGLCIPVTVVAVEDAVVKLVEVSKDERKPVSHTFTDKEGEFVFGPLCPGKKYSISIWKDSVKHFKICAKCHHEGKCLKGIDLKKCDCFVGKKEEFEKCKEICKDKKNKENEYEKEEYMKDNYKKI